MVVSFVLGPLANANEDQLGGDGQGSKMNRIGKVSFTQIFSRLSTQRAKHAAARSE
jgi:hypothetical protein